MLLPTLLLVLVPAAEPEITSSVIPGESRAATLQVQDFRKAAAALQWDEALTEYNGLLARPFDLAPLTPRYLVQSRWLAHRELGTFSPEVRARLLEPRQAAARVTLERAIAGVDEARLRQLVEEAFGTPAAAQACAALGDLAFERGDFETAALWYRLPLSAPDPVADLARVRAKGLLARIFAAKQLGAAAPLAPALQADLDEFAQKTPDAAGKLAGKMGKYATLLRELVQARDLEAPPASDYATFGGAPGRFAVLPSEDHLGDRLVTMTRRPTLRINLDTREPGADDRLGKPSVRWNGGLGTYPALADGTLYFADARYLTAVHLATGDVRTIHDAGRDVSRSVPAPDGFRATVTVAGDYVLSRHGVTTVQEWPKRTEANESYLVCQRREADGSLRRAWSVRASTHEGTFEGAPVVAHGRAYAALTRVQGERTLTAIQCYALDARGEAKPLWARDICESIGTPPLRCLHHLLTLAGPYLVYASHSGAIVALDPVTGQRIWAQRYPSAVRANRKPTPGTEGQPPVHDLAPPLFAAGHVYVAPSDSETLFCLDPWTGAVVWQRDGIQAVHLLGVHQDRLILTTPERIRAISARDGGDKPGWVQDGPAPLGRGQLVGDVILYPTVATIFVLQAETGLPVFGPFRLERVAPGNVLYHDGTLVVATRTALSVYRGEKRVAVDPRELERGAKALAGAAGQDALAQAARLWARAGEPERAVRLWQGLANESGTILDAQRRPWPTATLAARELAGVRGKPEPLQVGELLDQARALAKENPPAARTVWRTLARQGNEAAARELAQTVPKGVAPPLPRDWQLGAAVALEPGERLIPGTNLLLTATPHSRGSVLRLRPGFSAELGFVPTWASVWEEQVLVAGVRGLANVRLDGHILWQVRSLEGFDSVQHTGDRLLLRVGTSRLRALDALTGAILWEFALAHHLLTARAHIAPNYVATERRVWLRTPGRRHLLDAATGKLLRQEDAPDSPGPDATLLVDGQHLLVAERQRVELLELDEGSSVWSWPIPAQTTARHEPVRLLRVGRTVWVQVPVNIGHELHRLDLAKGTPQAELPRLMRAEPFDLAAGAVQGDTAYLVEGAEVVARAALDGAVRWRVALPAGPARYRVECVGGTVLVIPAAGRVVGAEFRCLAGQLEWMMKYPPAAGGLAPAPVLRLDATTGQARRLDVPTGVPSLAWSWRWGLLPYLSPEVRDVRRSEPADLHVLATPDGWRLVLGGRAWMLR